MRCLALAILCVLKSHCHSGFFNAISSTAETVVRIYIIYKGMFLGLTLPLRAHAAHLSPWRRHSLLFPTKVTDRMSVCSVSKERKSLKRPPRMVVLGSRLDQRPRPRRTYRPDIRPYGIHVPFLGCAKPGHPHLPILTLWFTSYGILVRLICLRQNRQNFWICLTESAGRAAQQHSLVVFCGAFVLMF